MYTLFFLKETITIPVIQSWPACLASLHEEIIGALVNSYCQLNGKSTFFLYAGAKPEYSLCNQVQNTGRGKGRGKKKKKLTPTLPYVF